MRQYPKIIVLLHTPLAQVSAVQIIPSEHEIPVAGDQADWLAEVLQIWHSYKLKIVVINDILDYLSLLFRRFCRNQK